MALTDNLVAWYALEEDFGQAISAVNSVPPNLMPLESVNDPASGTGGVFVQSVAGKVGNGAQGVEAASSVLLEAVSEHAIAILNRDKTFAFWVRLDTTKQESVMLGKGMVALEYAFAADTGFWTLSSATDVLSYPTAPVLNEWAFVIFWYDASTATAYMRVNGGNVVSAAFAVALQAGTPFQMAMGAASFDELAIWDRILTAAEQDELYNDGDGITYTALSEVASAAVTCRELVCCDEPIAEYVAATGEGKGYDSGCDPLPKVIFEPVSGAVLILPSLITLRTENPDAVIHYTTDGTAPDRNSPVYTAPITIATPVELIRAIAIVSGCPEGPEAVAQYQQWSPAAHFTYACTTTDKTGQWGAFTADGNADYNWELQIQFSAITSVKEFTILQVDSAGKFIGAAWSTKETIYPWEDDATKAHDAFPLALFTGGYGGVQQNVAYLDDYSGSLGTFAIGPHTLSMAGSPVHSSLPTGWMFKLLVTFGDGSQLSRIVDNVCDALPAGLCPVPSLVAAPQCGPFRIDLTYSLGIGTPVNLYRADSSNGPYTVIHSGLVGASPETFQDTAVLPGQTYFYYINNLPAGCVIYVGATGPTQATAIPNATVSIAASPSTIGVGANATIAWSSINNSGTVSISPTIGVQPGNVAGNQVVAPAVTTTYTITGQNVCGTVVQAQVTVVVLPAATCGALPPSLVQILGYVDALFSVNACGGLVPSSGPAWPGYLTLIDPGNAPYKTCYYSIPSGFSVQGNALLGLELTQLEVVGGAWVLSIELQAAGAVLLWKGQKTTGTSPLGVYTRISGCSLQPASVELV